MKLANRCLEGHPVLLKRKPRTLSLFKALPMGLRGPTAAANPQTLNECMSNAFNPLLPNQPKIALRQWFLNLLSNQGRAADLV